MNRIANLVHASLLSALLACTGCNGISGMGGDNAAPKDKKDARKGGNEVDQSQVGKKGGGATFRLALPEGFEDVKGDDDDDDEYEKESKYEDDELLKEGFEDALQSNRIQITCEGKEYGEEDLETMMSRKVRGIFELALVQHAVGGGSGGAYPDENYPAPPKDPGVSHGPVEYYEGDDFAYDGDGPLENQDPSQCQEPQKAPPKSSKSSSSMKEWRHAPIEQEPVGPSEIEPGFISVEHIVVPFTCVGHATVRLVGLEDGIGYEVEARLFSAEGGLSYQGSTGSFLADAKAIDLLMSPVQSKDVDINVIFADAK